MAKKNVSSGGTIKINPFLLHSSLRKSLQKWRQKRTIPQNKQNAVEAVQKGEKVATAALKFGVPRVTLHNKVTGISPLVCSMGPSTYLMKEDEDILEKWIIDMNNKHIPITKDELLDSVQRIITDKNKNLLSTTTGPARSGIIYSSLFRCEKLDLFKELYYKNRTDLDDCLPAEDTSLSTSWASMKSSVAKLNQINNISVLIPDVMDSAIAADVTFPELQEIATVDNQPPAPRLSKDILPEDTPTRSGAKEILLSALVEVPCTSRQAAAITQKEPEITNCNIEVIASIEPNPGTYGNENSQDAGQAPSLCRPDMTLTDTSGTSQCGGDDINVLHAVEKTPRKELEVDSSSSDLNASKNKDITISSSRGISDKIIIPSPFKRNLFWPEEDEIQKGKKRRLREKIPFVITSQAWRKYHQNKESQKKIKLNEKEKKTKEGADKKLFKETLKRQTKKNKEKIKRKEPDGTSSDETDAEIQYAESDDSYSDETYLANFRKTQLKNDSSSETEDPPSRPSSRNKLSTGVYVIVKYEGEYFPGVIENEDQESYEISTMTFSTGNTFRWPNKPDTIWYAKKDIEI